MTNEPHDIKIYTDGACSPNPGPGGYGVIVAHDGRITELSGGFRNTTNNRMEIYAALAALRAFENGAAQTITIYSDSRYLVDMFNGGYVAKWRAKGWILSSKKRAMNIDLWTELLELTAGRPITFTWVRGHDEHPENERCDALAVAARQEKDLPIDEGYEQATEAVAPQQLSLFDDFQ